MQMEAALKEEGASQKDETIVTLRDEHSPQETMPALVFVCVRVCMC